MSLLMRQTLYLFSYCNIIFINRGARRILNRGGGGAIDDNPEGLRDVEFFYGKFVKIWCFKMHFLRYLVTSKS